MGVSEIVQRTVDSGAAPLALTYEEVLYFGSKKRIVRSMLEINSLELGKLRPKQYKVVAGRGKQGGELLRRQLAKVLEAFPDICATFDNNVDCVTIPILSRTLFEGTAAKIIFEEFEKNASVSPSFICFEVSSDILFEEADKTKARIDELRDLGVKLAMCEVGDEFFPIFRLKSLPLEYAFADGFATDNFDPDDESSRVLPELTHLLGIKLFAPHITEGEAPGVRKAGYDGYSLDIPPIEAASRKEVDSNEEQ